jgi:hypothetical protein
VEPIEGISEFGTQGDVFGGEFLRAGLNNKSLLPIQPGMYYGICLSFDNLNKMVRPKEYHSATKTKVLNMTSAYAVFNRIPIAVSEMLKPFTPKKMADLDLHTWLLREDEVLSIREDHVREIKKILTHYLGLFKTIDSKEYKFPHHCHEKESGTPSTFVRCRNLCF